MNDQTILALKRLNNDFYRANHASFSQTRQHAWPGWHRVLDVVDAPRTVLDIACGNMRFKRFIDERFGTGVRYFGVDSCTALTDACDPDSFLETDIIDALMEGSLVDLLAPYASDLTISFGFMHHIPTHKLRSRFLEALVSLAGEGGVVSASFWQFALDENMRMKACATTDAGCARLGLELEEGDYLLGWNNRENAYRYCHSFTDEEVDELLAGFPFNVHVLDRFHSDGRSGEMNAYCVLGLGR